MPSDHDYNVHSPLTPEEAANLYFEERSLGFSNDVDSLDVFAESRGGASHSDYRLEIDATDSGRVQLPCNVSKSPCIKGDSISYRDVLEDVDHQGDITYHVIIETDL